MRRDKHAVPSLEEGVGKGPCSACGIGKTAGGETPAQRRTLRDRHAKSSHPHEKERKKTPPPLQAGDGHQRGAATPTHRLRRFLL